MSALGDVLRTRRQAHREEGPLAAVFRQAMVIWDAQKAEGVPLVERVSGLAKSLREVWPQTREWKYLCHRCDDYGLEMASCPGDATCGRTRAHLAHDFGKPCWCAAGKRHQEKAKPGAEDFTSAGKSKPMSRPGRW